MPVTNKASVFHLAIIVKRPIFPSDKQSTHICRVKRMPDVGPKFAARSMRNERSDWMAVTFPRKVIERHYVIGSHIYWRQPANCSAFSQRLSHLNSAFVIRFCICSTVYTMASSLWGILEWCGEGGNYNVYQLLEINEPRKAFQEYKVGEVVSAKFNRGTVYPAKIKRNIG